jgi:cation-transporting ATPase 13A1
MQIPQVAQPPSPPPYAAMEGGGGGVVVEVEDEDDVIEKVLAPVINNTHGSHLLILLVILVLCHVRYTNTNFLLVFPVLFKILNLLFLTRRFFQFFFPLSPQILLYLFTIWSVDIRCTVRYSKVKSLAEATLIKVVPHAFTGTREVVPVEQTKINGGGDGDKPYITFSFRKLKFIWEDDEQVFRKLQYPVHLTFAEYRASTGHGKVETVKLATSRWGLNKFEVPIPKFWELLQEQLVAPFFCFQVFCVALWALDEFWYYSILTLFMLVTFESTVVGQRLRNLNQVRSLQQPRQPLKVYRGGKWENLSGDLLVPGDLVSLARPSGSTEDVIVQADMLLLAGTCIVDEAVLTGESTPQWKNPIGEATGDEVDASELSPSARLSIKRDRMHVVFGGTKLVQCTGDNEAHVRTPDNGCLAIVLRTGFGTAQGSLMRTILYSTERVTANNFETFGFILFLLMWAVAASYYVLQHGLADPDRDRFKLFLNCTMILTSVVPPELPMELTIAVNASLVALARKRIFCTEPFRIPIAGKVTTCCFDKTGTLTSDHMELEGVVGSITKLAPGSTATTNNTFIDDGVEDDELHQDVKLLPAVISRVLACCQSLVQVDGSLVGDPVERAGLQATGWTAKGDVVQGPVLGSGKEIATILHRFHFSSVLKRMSTVVRVDGKDPSNDGYYVLAKGAPEVIAAHLGSVPSRYERQYKRYASEGARVLALAYKKLPDDMTPSALRHTPRDEAESNLIFAGFAIFRSPLKPDSEPSLRMLRASQHQLIMITGDAPLTACHTAAQVHIVTRQPMILSTAGPPSAWVWNSPDEAISEPFDVENISSAYVLAETYDLCLNGDALTKLPEVGADMMAVYISLTSVFARVTPEQKELVVKTLRAEGLSVLMCGDGTNDVGALKGAHVGVALLPPPEPLKNKTTPSSAAGAGAITNGNQLNSSGGQGGDIVEGSQPPAPAAPAELGPGAKMLEDLRRRGMRPSNFHIAMARRMDDMAAESSGDAPMVRPGDASMAAPFTAKDPSVAPCLDILRQGRCTLVTTVQMFKILGLLSLSMAYSLSVMYLDGIKLGDMQATLAGLLTAGMFFFISNAQPLPQLSRQRPHSRIFSMYMFSSLLGQFGVHMAYLMYMQQTAHALMLPEDRQEPDAEFKPNLINTVCFLANFAIQTMTFAVNYVGEPFATPLAENKMFAISVRYSVGMFVILTLDVVYGLTGWFSLVEMPGNMRYQMLGLAWLAFVACTFIERLARTLFPAETPPEKGGYKKRK